jgi:hypothetical protein
MVGRRIGGLVLLTLIFSRCVVRALYEYAAQGPDEMTLAPDEIIELSAGPSGGQNYGSGWWEGRALSERTVHLLTLRRCHTIRQDRHIPE